MNDLQILPPWLDAGAAALAGAVPPALTLAGALPGLNQAQQLNPLLCLQRLQESGLTRCGFSGEPIYQAWRQFIRGHGTSQLVVDAASLDARARGNTAVFDSAPWLLAEGLLIAAGLRNTGKVELRLPAELMTRGILVLWITRHRDDVTGCRIHLQAGYARTHGCTRGFEGRAHYGKASLDRLRRIDFTRPQHVDHTLDIRAVIVLAHAEVEVNEMAVRYCQIGWRSVTHR